eukprot:INCI5092.1.p1 GENE.INCI5092.1~~INCI5092.1.p1  ORF type:complete len:1126 (-),score=168.35 INCI5092.1:1947-5324(-)
MLRKCSSLPQSPGFNLALKALDEMPLSTGLVFAKLHHSGLNSHEEFPALVPFSHGAWTTCLLDVAVGNIAASRCITQRKSAGLPFLVLALLQVAPATVASRVVAELLALSQHQGFDLGSASGERSEWDERGCVAATHTLNLLSGNVATAHLLSSHLAACLRMAIHGLGARHSYNVRQACLCFYGQLVGRMVCHKRGRDEHDRDNATNPALSVPAFFRLYPSLLDTCLDHLENDSEGTGAALESASNIGSVSPAYAILLLLSRLSPAATAQSVTVSASPARLATSADSGGRDANSQNRHSADANSAQWRRLLHAVVDFGTSAPADYTRRVAAAAVLPLLLSGTATIAHGIEVVHRVAHQVAARDATALFFNAAHAGCVFLTTLIRSLHQAQTSSTPGEDGVRSFDDRLFVAIWREALACARWMWDMSYGNSGDDNDGVFTSASPVRDLVEVPEHVRQALLQVSQVLALTSPSNKFLRTAKAQLQVGLGRNDLVCGGVSVLDGADCDTLLLSGLLAVDRLPVREPQNASAQCFPTLLLRESARELFGQGRSHTRFHACRGHNCAAQLQGCSVFFHELLFGSPEALKIVCADYVAGTAIDQSPIRRAPSYADLFLNMCLPIPQDDSKTSSIPQTQDASERKNSHPMHGDGVPALCISFLRQALESFGLDAVTQRLSAFGVDLFPIRREPAQVREDDSNEQFPSRLACVCSLAFSSSVGSNANRAAGQAVPCAQPRFSPLFVVGTLRLAMWCVTAMCQIDFMQQSTPVELIRAMFCCVLMIVSISCRLFNEVQSNSSNEVSSAVLATLSPIAGLSLPRQVFEDFLRAVCFRGAAPMYREANDEVVYLLDVCDSPVTWAQIEFCGTIVGIGTCAGRAQTTEFVEHWVSFLQKASCLEDTAPEFRMALLESVRSSRFLLRSPAWLPNNAEEKPNFFSPESVLTSKRQLQLLAILVVLLEDTDPTVRRTACKAVHHFLNLGAPTSGSNTILECVFATNQPTALLSSLAAEAVRSGCVALDDLALLHELRKQLEEHFVVMSNEAQTRAISSPSATEPTAAGRKKASLPFPRAVLAETYKFKNPARQWARFGPLLSPQLVSTQSGKETIEATIEDSLNKELLREVQDTQFTLIN